MVSLGGLSAAYPGFQSAESTGLQNREREYALREADLERQGLALAGLSFGDLQTRRPLMQPGQASVPMTQPSQQPGQQPPGSMPAAFAGANTTGLPPMDQFIQARAQQYGVDPATAIKVAQSEGLGNRVGDQGTSFGPFQLHVGGGLGDTFQQQTGLDPRSAANDYAGTDWALRNAPQTGWSPYHGAAHVGIGAREGLPGGTPGRQSLDQSLPQQVGIQDVIAAIESRAPNAPPELKMRALTKMMPLIKMDDRAYVAQMNAIYQQARIGQGDTRLQEAQQKIDNLEKERAAAGGRADQRIDTARMNPFIRAKLAKDAAAEKQTQALENTMNVEKYRADRKDALQERIQAGKATDSDRRMLEIERHNLETEKQRQQGIDARTKPTMDTKTIDNLAERSLVDPQATKGLAKGDLAAVLNRRTEIAAGKNMSMQDQIDSVVGMAGEKAAAQTAGRIHSYVEQAGSSFESLLPVVKGAFDKVQLENLRTRFPTVNAFLQATDAQLGDPNVISLKSAIQGAINEYAQVMNRGRGTTSVFSQKKAEELLNQAWNGEQFEASVKTLQAEVKAVRGASEKLVNRYKPFAEEGADGGDTTEAPAKPFTSDTLPPKFKALNQAINNGLSIDEGIKVLRADGDNEADIERFRLYRENLEKKQPKKSEAEPVHPKASFAGGLNDQTVPYSVMR